MKTKNFILLFMLIFLSLFQISCSQRKTAPQPAKKQQEQAKGYLVYINEDSPGKSIMYSAAIESKEKKKKLFEKNPYSPAGYDGKIAFMSDETGKKSLYMINADGSELKTIAKDINIIPNTLSWAPDGKKLLFAAKLPADSFEQIYYIEPGEDKTPVNVTASAGSKKSPVLTGDGKFLIYSCVRENSYDIVKHDMASQSETVLFGSPGNDISPVVTPDGTRMLFLSDEKTKGMYNLYMMDIDGGNRIEITSGLNIAENSLRVSPDNSMVSFITFDNMGKMSARVMNMNRSTVMISNDVHITAWSGNGKKLYYGTFDPKSRKVVEYDVSGKTMKDVFKVEYKPGEESTGMKFIHFTDKPKEE